MKRSEMVLVGITVVVGGMLGGALAGCMTRAPNKSPTGKTTGLSRSTPPTDGKPVRPEAAERIATEALRIVDADGEARMEAWVADNGAVGLRARDTKGELRTTLAINADQDPFITMYDDDGAGRVQLSDSDGVPELLMCDADETRSVVVAHLADGPAVVLARGDTDPRVVLRAETNGLSKVSLYDGEAERIHLGVQADGSGAVAGMADETGASIWQAP